MKNRFFLLLIMLSLSFTAFGNDTDTIGNFFRSDLKIYVVTGVFLIILSLLFAFLFAIDGRLKKAEEKITRQ